MSEETTITSNIIQCLCGNQQPHTYDCLSKQVILQKAQAERQKTVLQDKNYRSKYGEVNPLKNTVFNGDRYTLAGGALYQSTSEAAKNNLHDFYCQHLIDLLGREWFFDPLHSCHPIVAWYHRMCDYMREQKEKYVVPSAYSSAFMILAYDIFCLRNHASLQKQFIDDLRGTVTNYKQFQGIRYELTVYALLIRAGFDLSYKDRRKGESITECIATHKDTGLKIDVEAKSLHREGILGATEGRGVKLVRLLNKAIKKPFDYPYIIFVDANYPPLTGNLYDSQLFELIQEGIKKFEKDHCNKLPNIIFFTNISHHWAEDYLVLESEICHSVFEKFFDNPKFNLDKTIISAIKDGLRKYGVIPSSFDEMYM